MFSPETVSSFRSCRAPSASARRRSRRRPWAIRIGCASSPARTQTPSCIRTRSACSKSRPSVSLAPPGTCRTRKPIRLTMRTCSTASTTRHPTHVSTAIGVRTGPIWKAMRHRLARRCASSTSAQGCTRTTASSPSRRRRDLSATRSITSVSRQATKRERSTSSRT